jgi:hypothetical protein
MRALVKEATGENHVEAAARLRKVFGVVGRAVATTCLIALVEAIQNRAHEWN